MLIGETIQVALGSIRANKLRAMLTMLGVIIGVAAVITVVEVVCGGASAVVLGVACGAVSGLVSPGMVDVGASPVG